MFILTGSSTAPDGTMSCRPQPHSMVTGFGLTPLAPGRMLVRVVIGNKTTRNLCLGSIMMSTWN